MEFLLGLALVLIVLLLFSAYFNECNLKDLRNEFDSFKRETEFKLLLPQIQKLSEYKQLPNFFRHYEQVYFRSEDDTKQYVLKLEDVEKELKSIEDAIEKACPKKCKKK